MGKMLLKGGVSAMGKNGENVAEEWCFSNGKMEKMLLKGGVQQWEKNGEKCC
jgi:hypothetical protein